jgi:hypothetical protein
MAIHPYATGIPQPGIPNPPNFPNPRKQPGKSKNSDNSPQHPAQQPRLENKDPNVLDTNSLD